MELVRKIRCGKEFSQAKEITELGGGQVGTKSDRRFYSKIIYLQYWRRPSKQVVKRQGGWDEKV